MSNTDTAAAAVLTMRRRFDAPRARVFAAWTQPEMLRTWFGPAGTTVPDAQVDLREGGAYRIAMHMPDGELYVVRGVYTELRAPKLVFVHEGFVDAASRDRHEHGWSTFFERLGETLATHRPR